MYSWMPKLWTLRSKCSAAAMQTGERSVAPWQPVRTWYSSARCAILRRWRDAAGVHDRRADVVDELLLDELLAVVDAVEDLADRDRRRGVLADQAEALLQLGGHRVLHPEQVVGLELLAEAAGLDRRAGGGARRGAGAASGPNSLRSAREERRHERAGSARCSRRSRAAGPAPPARSTCRRCRRRRCEARPGIAATGRGSPCSRASA